jgi:hypothetical protein
MFQTLDLSGHAIAVFHYHHIIFVFRQRTCRARDDHNDTSGHPITSRNGPISHAPHTFHSNIPKSGKELAQKYLGSCGEKARKTDSVSRFN